MTPQASSDDAAPRTEPARVFYVSYDGVGDPLGRSQVLSYVFRLAGEFDITLFSFEKDDAQRDALHDELAQHGVTWRPLRYHRRPPVLSTLVDVFRGVVALRREARNRGRPSLVHVRSYVPALMATWARRFTGGSLIFDIRGFWADERIEGGIWPQNRLPYRLLYRVAKACERKFFATADAVVTLTHASLPQIEKWTYPRQIPVVVIPTCTDISRFEDSQERPDGPHLTWCGSVGTWYRFDLAAPLAAALRRPLDVVTQQPDAARAILGSAEASLQSVPPSEIPFVLHAGDIGLSLCVGTFSKTASAPTRFAEYLAAGMPVIVTPGIGDLVEIVERYQVGVVLGGDQDDDVRSAALRALELAGQPETRERCRRTARELFDVAVGSRRYDELYSSLVDESRRPEHRF